MNTITTVDGTPIFYKDWGSGKPVVFCHGWPLDADAWDAQMLFLLQHGYRVIAHDRRGHGRSGQPGGGHDMDTYADDLALLIGVLDLREATLVGHGAGGGELVRYIGRYGSKRLVKAVLVAAVPPLLLAGATNPAGLPLRLFDDLRQPMALRRAAFFAGLALPFYGYNRAGVVPQPGVVEAFCGAALRGAINAQYAGIAAYSATDFRDDLKKFNVPTLFLHGDDDQIVPLAASAAVAARLVRNAILKVYPGAPHGLCTTLAAQVNADLLAFLSD